MLAIMKEWRRFIHTTISVWVQERHTFRKTIWSDPGLPMLGNYRGFRKPWTRVHENQLPIESMLVIRAAPYWTQ